MTRRVALVAAAVVAAALVAAAYGRPGDVTPGITSDTIVLGATSPLSGPASAFASVERGADDYFKYVNDRGGINGRKIDYRILDDAFDPAQTVQQTRQLVQQEKVFAIFNSLGTEQNLAIRPYLNQLGVPQLFCATGVTTLGADYKQYPWTIGYIPSFTAEGKIYGRYLAGTKGRPRIAILYPDDEGGKNLVAGIKTGLGRKASEVVAAEAYDPTAADVQSQMAKLRASRATVFVNLGTPKYAIQAFVYASKLGWHPNVVLVAYSSASNIVNLATLATSKRQTEGTISTVFVKDPTDPRWAKDSTVALYKRIMRKYDPHGNAKDVYNVYGMAVAYTMVDTLKHAGKNPTRASVMSAALHLNERNPFMPPGIQIRTTPTNRFPIHQARLIRWHDGKWVSFGPLLDARG